MIRINNNVVEKCIVNTNQLNDYEFLEYLENDNSGGSIVLPFTFTRGFYLRIVGIFYSTSWGWSFGTNSSSYEVLLFGQTTYLSGNININTNMYRGRKITLEIDTTTEYRKLIVDNDELYNAINKNFNNKSIGIFCTIRSTDSEIPTPDKHRIYSVEYRLGTEHYYLVPAKRKLDGQYGLFDIINQQFYFNDTYNNYTAGELKNVDIEISKVIFNDTQVFPHLDPTITTYFAHAEGSKTRCAVQGNISTIADKYDTSATPVRFVSTGEDETYRFSILTGNVSIPDDFVLNRLRIKYYGKANKNIYDTEHILAIGIRQNEIGHYVLDTSSDEHVLTITEPSDIALIAPYIVNGQPITLWFLDETDTTSEDFVELNALQIELNY